MRNVISPKVDLEKDFTLIMSSRKIINYVTSKTIVTICEVRQLTSRLTLV